MSYAAGKRVMWLAQVRSLPYRERVEVAARSGCGWLI